MTRRKHTKDDAPPAVYRPSGVQAIFDPAGNIRVRATSPSGNVYEVVPRVSFHIAEEDVDWFFYGWDWEHRQRLSRAEEYQPRQAQFNNGRRVETWPVRPQFDHGSAEVTSVPEVDPLTELLVETEPVDHTEPEAETPEEMVDQPEPDVEPEIEKHADDEAPADAAED